MCIKIRKIKRVSIGASVYNQGSRELDGRGKSLIWAINLQIRRRSDLKRNVDKSIFENGEGVERGRKEWKDELVKHSNFVRIW